MDPRWFSVCHLPRILSRVQVFNAKADARFRFSLCYKVLLTFRLMVLAAVDDPRPDPRFREGLRTSGCLVL